MEIFKEDDYWIGCEWCQVMYDIRDFGYCDNCGGSPGEPPESDRDDFGNSSEAYRMDAELGTKLGN